MMAPRIGERRTSDQEVVDSTSGLVEATPDKLLTRLFKLFPCRQSHFQPENTLQCG